MPYLLALTVLFLPTYALRFNIFGLPSNFLMAWVFLLWLLFICFLILKKQFFKFCTSIKNIDKKVLIFVTFFLLSGLISLFVQGFSEKKLAQFIVLFIQPISLFFIFKFTTANNPKTKTIILFSLYFILALMGIWSAVQYFTLLSLPTQYWGNAVEPKRALGFFGHPNFYALFSAPLLAFLIPSAFSLPKSGEGLRERLILISAWLLGAIGLFLSMSRAGWLGLGAGMLVYLIVAANKQLRKIASAVIIVMVIVIFSVPNLRWRFTLPFYGEKSAISRLSLWQTGWKGVKESPILGLGLTGFSQNWKSLNTDPGLSADSHNFPHNIFLNFWVETGLLGLISFIGIVSIFINRGLRSPVVPEATSETRAVRNLDSRSPIGVEDKLRGNDTTKLSVALFLMALLTQGLIDNPYFKNDLAILFWIILSMI